MAKPEKDSEKKVAIELSKDYIKSVPDELIGITQDAMKKLLTNSNFYCWSGSQQKLLFSILSKINWREGGNNTDLVFNNEELMRELGWDVGRKRSLKQMLEDDFRFIRMHSEIYIQNPYTEEWISTGLIEAVGGKRGITLVKLRSEIMPHLENMFSYYKKTRQPFLLTMKGDFKGFTSSFSIPFYTKLWSAYKPKYHPNQLTISLEELRTMFQTKDKYYRKDKNGNRTGKFDYANFEKRTLLRAIEDVNTSEAICVMQYEDGSWYKKEKSGGSTVGYTFRYYVRDEKAITKRRKQKVIEAEAVKISDMSNKKKGTV